MASTKKKQVNWNLLAILSVVGYCLFLYSGTLGPTIVPRIDRSNTEVFLEEIESGLSMYFVNFAFYPENPPSGTDLISRESSGLKGANILYQHLSGDFDLDGILYEPDGVRDTGDKDMRIFVDKLNWEANRTAKSKRCAPNPAGPGYIVIDPYGDPIRYVAERAEKKGKLTLNPTYDIWSIGNTNPLNAAKPETISKYITNWKRN